MNITVIGCGRWGSFIAWYLNSIKRHTVTLYGREGSENMKKIIAQRGNDLLKYDDDMNFSTDISCVKNSDVIVISVNSQGLRALTAELKSVGIDGKTVVLCMKGIEISTGKRLSQIVFETFGNSVQTAVWLGPGHVHEFYRGIPNCMVIDSENEGVKKKLVDEFSSELIRFYYGDDLIGNEVGAAAKNVIGIAAGMLDGLELSTLKGALMSRGTREVARLIKAMGGNELSAYGLCHLGDYEATVFSKFSHNREYGEKFIKGEKYDKLAEGCHTVKALKGLEEKYGVELPICNAVYDVLYNGANAKQVLNSLFSRSTKNEFYQ